VTDGLSRHGKELKHCPLHNSPEERICHLETTSESVYLLHSRVSCSMYFVGAVSVSPCNWHVTFRQKRCNAIDWLFDWLIEFKDCQELGTRLAFSVRCLTMYWCDVRRWCCMCSECMWPELARISRVYVCLPEQNGPHILSPYMYTCHPRKSYDVGKVRACEQLRHYLSARGRHDIQHTQERVKKYWCNYMYTFICVLSCTSCAIKIHW
jgi:hypothetical protein